MIKHFIILSSAYTEGARIALDITDPSLMNEQSLQRILSFIKSECGEDVPLAMHIIESESYDWKSVENADPFFKGVIHTTSATEFAVRVRPSRTLTGMDVAIYILAKHPCTHLMLEKLVYFAYADYMQKYSEKLFTDAIYAFRFGPVVETVYHAFNPKGYLRQSQDEEKVFRTTTSELSAKSRILFARKGIEKLQSIDQTLSRYGSLAPADLVNLTHRDDSPWRHVYDGELFTVIPDELIIQYHHVETLS